MNRRQFIQTTAAVSALSAFGFDALAKPKTLKNFGCQLYSVRDKMSGDPINTMRKLAQMGYTQFESYSKDPFWGMNPAQAKAFLKEIGVDMVSAHVGVPDITDEMAAKAKEVGLKYLISPYIGGQKSAEEWKKRAEEFNKAGELCKKHGLKFGYHNHGYSFEEKNGVLGQQLLLDNTDPKLVMFELDLYWTEISNVNSVKHLQANKGRYELVHVKQLATKEPKPVQGTLDKGFYDYAKILPEAKKAGVKYFLVEQEQYAGDSMDAMAVNANYMKTLKV